MWSGTFYLEDNYRGETLGCSFSVRSRAKGGVVASICQILFQSEPRRLKCAKKRERQRLKKNIARHKVLLILHKNGEGDTSLTKTTARAFFIEIAAHGVQIRTAANLANTRRKDVNIMLECVINQTAYRSVLEVYLATPIGRLHKKRDRYYCMWEIARPQDWLYHG